MLLLYQLSLCNILHNLFFTNLLWYNNLYITLPSKVHIVKAMVWEMHHKESWVPKNWCFWTVVLEKTLESSLDCMEIQPIHPKGNQSWIFFWRTDVEAETPILWPPDANNWLIWKTLMLGKIEVGRRRGWQRMRWLDASLTQWTWIWVGSGSWWWTGKPGMLQSCGHKDLDTT